ncbi:MAG: glycosyltransferase [Planctomycetia bacterium]|nr:glycosyltransferase [Planctomycetia bacterium]
MKILFFIGNGAFVHSVGGAEKVACNMANDLVLRGHEIVIVSNDIESGVPVYPLDERIRLINLNGTGKKLYRISRFQRLLREITRPIQDTWLGWFLRHTEMRRRGRFFAPKMKSVLDCEKPDIVLCFFYEDLYLLPFFETGPTVPVIQMFHGPPSRTLRYSCPRLTRMLCQCSAVQVLLPSFVRELERFGIRNISVIPNWANEYEKEVEYRGTEKGQILYVGRISKEKRPHLLIQAFALIARKHPHWTLDLYGTGKGRYYDFVMSLIQSSGLDGQIIYHGITNRVEEAMRASDIFAFPSEFEGFCLALADAMSIGLPAVGFQGVLAVGELIQDQQNGLLAENGIQSFAEKLEILIENPELRAFLGRNARQFAASFNQKEIMDSWEKLMKKIAADD